MNEFKNIPVNYLKGKRTHLRKPFALEKCSLAYSWDFLTQLQIAEEICGPFWVKLFQMASANASHSIMLSKPLYTCLCSGLLLLVKCNL